MINKWKWCFIIPMRVMCVDAYIMGESLWITQKAMAELFGVQVPAISKHLKKIFE